MRLIDADALVDDGLRFQDGYDYDGTMMVRLGDVTKSIRNAPTIDAVPVVRCGDCVYCNTERTNYPGNDWDGSCDYWNTHSVDFSWFCSQGERKDGADNG